MFASWQYAQGQYYLGIDRGNMAIFRGVNTSVAGISLGSVYQRTSVPVAQLPANERLALRATVSEPGLPAAQRVAALIAGGVYRCRQEWLQLVGWKKTNDAYQRALAAKAHRSPGTASPPLPADPGPMPPPPLDSMCGPASAYGIPATALPPGTPDTGFAVS
jgi:hypothetical protein